MSHCCLSLNKELSRSVVGFSLNITTHSLNSECSEGFCKSDCNWETVSLVKEKSDLCP